MNGKVKTVNESKGYGFIRGEDGTECFFHKSDCQNVDFADLSRGRDVTFEPQDGDKGPRASDVCV